MNGSYDEVSKRVNKYSNVLILGSDEYYPIALEAALKLKEVAYIHAEAMPADEIKHGPIALIDESTISIVIGDSTNNLLNKLLKVKK